MPFIGNKPSAVPLTSADIADGIITSAKIVDATIANADIANSTINLTTKVTGTLPVANGGTGLAALGTSLQVLRTNSGATALEFASASSDYVRLATTTISGAVASVEITTGFSDTYPIYCLYYQGVKVATNLAQIRLQFGTGGTPTYSTSSYSGADNCLSANLDAAGATSISNGDKRTTGIGLTSLGSNGLNNSASFNLNGFMMLYNLRSTATILKFAMNQSAYYASDIEIFLRCFNAGFSEDTTVRDNAVTAIKILTSSGNLSAGTFVLYGIKTA